MNQADLVPSPFFQKKNEEYEALAKIIKNPVIIITLKDGGKNIGVDNFNVTKELSENTLLVIAESIIRRRKIA